MNKFIVMGAGLLAAGSVSAHEAAHLDPVSHTLAHTADAAVLALAIGAAVVSVLAALLRTISDKPTRR